MLTHPYSVVLTLLNVDFDNTFACDLGKTRSFVKIVQEVATYIRQRNCRSGSKPELKILKYLQKPHVSLQGNQVKKTGSMLGVVCSRNILKQYQIRSS